MELCEQFIRTGAVLGLLVLFLPQNPERTVGLIVLGMITCEVFSAVTLFFLTRRQLSRAGSREEGRHLNRRIASIAVPIGLTSLLGNLMGAANAVVIPQKLASRSSVFIAMNGILTGIFNIKYEPQGTVRAALAGLLHSRRDPLFAVRDFLVTPLMLRQKYRLPTDGFDFPPFARRYEVSGAEPGEDSQLSALLSREGLGSFVEVADCGRHAYLASALGAALSVVCAVVGIVLFFVMIVTGGAGAVSVSNVMTYMFLWLAPVLVADIASAV